MTTVPFTDLQAVNPSAIIELYEIALDSTLHGSTDILKFHNGTSLNNNGDISFGGGDPYVKFPIECKGFEYTAKGQYPRPTITVSNASGFITASTGMFSNLQRSGSKVLSSGQLYYATGQQLGLSGSHPLSQSRIEASKFVLIA